MHLKNGLIRQYSICSPTENNNYYQLCVNLPTHSRGGATHLHNNILVGDKLTISHPRNNFPLPEAEKYYFFAGGIGITPLLVMAETVAAKGIRFELHYFTSHKDQIALKDRLYSADLLNNVFFHESSSGDSIRNKVPACLQKPPIGKAAIITCGPLGFMKHIKEIALKNGWQSSDYYSEQFQNEGLFNKDTNREFFSVQISSTQQVFEIKTSESIADVLIRNGIFVDLSCEQGMGGACLTKIISGTPEHNDVVQSDAEKALNNYMTLCCSRSKSELLVLDL